MNEHLQAVEQVKSTVIDLAIKFGPKVFVALVILAVGFFVGRWIGRATDRMLKKLQLEMPIRLLLVRIVRVLVLGLFLIMALQNLGVELLPGELVVAPGTVATATRLRERGVQP